MKAVRMPVRPLRHVSNTLAWRAQRRLQGRRVPKSAKGESAKGESAQEGERAQGESAQEGERAQGERAQGESAQEDRCRPGVPQ